VKKLNCSALFLLFFLITSLSYTSNAFAHPGRTDANGGHTCRTNCVQYGLQDGEYHYPNGGDNTAPVQEAQKVVPLVQQSTQQTIPTKRVSSPTSIPTKVPTILPTSKPYLETEMDKKKMFKVISIIDGDTIDVSVRGKTERVRLLSVDSPETKDPRKPVQCFGAEATKKLQSMISGKFVKLTSDRTQGDRDKYKRLLRYVHDGNIFINAEMVKQGYAFSYKEYPTKYLTEFNSYEKLARENSLGLWSACNAVSPTKSVTITVPTNTNTQKNFVPQVKQQAAPLVYTSGGDKDCSDFSTHSQAQAFFNAAGAGDPHGLDRDADGLACETLP